MEMEDAGFQSPPQILNLDAEPRFNEQESGYLVCAVCFQLVCRRCNACRFKTLSQLPRIDPRNLMFGSVDRDLTARRGEEEEKGKRRGRKMWKDSNKGELWRKQKLQYGVQRCTCTADRRSTLDLLLGGVGDGRRFRLQTNHFHYFFSMYVISKWKTEAMCDKRPNEGKARGEMKGQKRCARKMMPRSPEAQQSLT